MADEIKTRISETAHQLATQVFLKIVQSKSVDPVAFAEFVNQSDVKNSMWLALTRDKIVRCTDEIVSQELKCRHCNGTGSAGGGRACNHCAGTGRSG